MDEDKMKKESKEIKDEELNDVAGGRESGLTRKSCPNCGNSVYFLRGVNYQTCSSCGTGVSR